MTLAWLTFPSSLKGRGILGNIGLGAFRDNVESLKEAINYLNRGNSD